MLRYCTVALEAAKLRPRAGCLPDLISWLQDSSYFLKSVHDHHHHSLLLSRALISLHHRHSLHPILVSLHGLQHAAAPVAFRSVAAQLCPDYPSPPHSLMECQAAIRAALHHIRRAGTPLLLVLDVLPLFVTDPVCQNVLYAFKANCSICCRTQSCPQRRHEPPCRC